MKKRIVTIALVAALLATCFAGTYAYLQDTDKAVNTMTLGSVAIEQYEYQRTVNEDGTYATGVFDGEDSYVLEAYKNDKPLYPIVGDPNEPGNSPAYAGWDETTVRMSQVKSYGGMQVFAGKNAQDKFVTVANIGKTDAYVRTLVAIEVGTANPGLVRISYHNTWTSNDIGVVEIDGNKYYVYEFVYAGGQLRDGSWRHENGVLPAGDTTYPNLAQVYLKHNATNEDMVNIDGNKNGKLDILVLSQAVQAAGFAKAQTALDTAFGDVTAENLNNWFYSVIGY